MTLSGMQARICRGSACSAVTTNALTVMLQAMHAWASLPLLQACVLANVPARLYSLWHWMPRPIQVLFV